MDLTTMGAKTSSASDENSDQDNGWEPWQTLLILFGISVMIIGTIGNLVTITAFFKFRNLQDATNCLICNQSFADVLSVNVTWAYLLYTYYPAGRVFVTTHKYVCLVYLWVSSAALVGSFVNIMSISIERLIAITLPFFNMNPRKKDFILVLIISAWTVIFFGTGMPTFGMNTWQYGTQCSVYFVYKKLFLTHLTLIPMFASLALTALLNILIGISVLKRQLRRAKVAPGHEITQISTTGNQSTNTGASKLKSTSKSSSRRITLMLLMVVGAFYVCWMPYLCISCFSTLQPLRYASMPDLIIIHEFSKILMMLNGMLNPFIYANRNPQFKKAFKQLLGRQS